MSIIEQPKSIREDKPSSPLRSPSDVRAFAPTRSKKITVCFLIDNLSVAGTENHLLQLIHDLDRNEFEPILVLLDGENEHSKSLEPNHCEVVRLGFKSFLRPSTILLARRFSKWLRTREVDVLQLYFPDSSFFGAITGWWAGVKMIVRTRRNSGYWMTNVHRLRCRLITRLVHATVVNSLASEQSVIEQENAAPRTVSLIPNGVDLNRFETPAEFRKNAGEYAGEYAGEIATIGMLTNLREVKRVDVFVDAAAELINRFPELVFEIAGDGPLRPVIQEQIDRLSLTDCVRLVGSVSDVPKFLNRLDLLVSCSESEGLSNSMLESMASRTPVVASDISGNRNLIESEINGLLVPVGDPAALSRAIAGLIEEPFCAQQLSQNAYRFVKENFNQNEMVGCYETLYRDSVKDRDSKSSGKEIGHKPSSSNRPSLKTKIKSCLKVSFVVLAIALTFPFWIVTKLTKSEQVFLTSAQFFSMIPGLTGVFIRRGFYVMTLSECSWDCHVEFGTWFSHRNVRIAQSVYIGARCTIGMANIGKNVLIGSNVDILSGKNQHHFDDIDRPINQQGGTFEQVKLGDGCWIGNSSVVMDEIGTNSIVGAGSVVANRIPDRSIAVGNPAKVVKER